MTIYSSESNVPNKDNEKGGIDLPTGELSTKRADTVLKLIKETLEGIKSYWNRSNIKYNEPKIQTVIVPPKEEYKSGEDPNQQKFLNEQYVKVVVSVTALKGCGFDIFFEVNYDKVAESNLISSGGKKHECNAALYEVTANGQILKTVKNTDADMNNGEKEIQTGNGVFTPAQPGYGYRFNQFWISNEMGKTLLAASSDGTIKVEMRCLTPNNQDRGWGTGKCHQGVPHIIVKNKEGKIVKDFLPKNTDFTTKGIICILDKCGDVIKQG